jgi:imidazole glycerol-phosphate synthase subunit HisH
MERVALIDYGSGNLRSAAKALERAARESGSGHEVVVTDDAEVVRAADRIVLPGVGAFADCRNGLAAVAGMLEALDEAVIRKGRPILGVCVGLQLMAERGVEFGVHPGLGWLKGEVRKLEPADRALKVPHMGWNDIAVRRPHPVLEGLDGENVYFVHSYHMAAADGSDAVLAVADYGEPITAAAGRDNIVGTQFHPEKSQDNGQRLLRNFLAWRP